MDKKQAFYTAQELKELFRIPLPTIYELARKNKIPGSLRIGKHWRFSKTAIDQWIESSDKSVGACAVMDKMPQLESKKKEILVIEDDQIVLKTLCKLLQTHGYEVAACSGGGEAFDLFKRKSDWDLVLSDIRMSQEDGITTVRKIRDFERTCGKRPTPVIFMTGYADADVPVQAIKLGACDYFIKPFDIQQFLHSIQLNLQSCN